MAERQHKINFGLKSIPEYNGDPNKLSNFINSVNTVQALFGRFNPPLDDFDKEIALLTIKDKITGKALDSITDLEIGTRNDLRTHLINSFKDKTTSVTILNEILRIQNIRNPYKLLEIIKEKYLNFKSRINIEEEDLGTRIVIIRYAEKLIVNNFISSISDPYRNNLATRNPKTLTEIETLLENDFQYLKQNINPIPKPINKIQNILPQKFPGSSFPSKPIQFQNKNQPKNFAPRQNIRNAQFTKPTPMSTQTRQNFQPKNYFERQNKQFGPQKPNFMAEEINNTETLNENYPDEEIEENEYYPEEFYENNFENSNDNIENSNEHSSFLDSPTLDLPPDIKEKY